MQPTVDVKTIMSQLMDRLSNYANSSPEVHDWSQYQWLKLNIYEKFNNSVVAGPLRFFASRSFLKT